MDTAEQVQELVAAVQSLTLEVQNMKSENTVIRQLVSTRDHHPSDLPPMALSSGKFDGSPEKLKEFMEACIVHFAFRASACGSEHTQVGFMISNLASNTLAWAAPLVSSNNPVLHDYKAFLNLLKQTFERPKIMYGTCEELLDVQQGTADLLSYITHFKSLAAEAGCLNRHNS
ncbi:protein LDOC1-like [Ambystoma mexicanum]|uniref:protein LDOC1-like n=1 Tax=Ambystoma mexicanum TaxID=8296 RepID=UPI0037E81C8D